MMRVAVCISGAFNTGNPRGDLVRNNTIQKAKFPNADFYYATWERYKPDFEKLFPNETCVYFPEPIMHYHPYEIKKKDQVSRFYSQTQAWIKKGGEERWGWSSHHTKQILIHSWLLNTIPKEYDVIVRTRFDGFISKNANFTPYLKDTFQNHRANCFGATHQEKFPNLTEINTNNPKQKGWSNRLLDQLMIHNSDVLSNDNVMSLHTTKKLHPAEYGWWQTISMPCGSKHRNFSGWVNHDKRVLDKFLFEDV